MTEDQAFDLGYSASFHGEEPSFTGPWNLFHSYHQGYEQNRVNNELDNQRHQED